MFTKSYKLKSNTTLKNSEKKHLTLRLLEEFPGATEENVKELVPAKSITNCMKVVLHSGDLANVYVVDGVPMVIEDAKGLVPTVCALWKVPDLVPTLIIHTPVLPKMACGAPLYLPGVCRGAWGAWARGAALAAATQDNRAAAAVGRATLAAREMAHLVAGVCLDTIHVYGDQLCKEVKFRKIDRPRLGPAAYPGQEPSELAADLSQLTVQPPLREEWPSLGRRPPPTSAPAPALAPAPAPASYQPKLIPEEQLPDPEHANDDTELIDLEDSAIEPLEEGGVPVDMDGLLRWCLLSFLKLEGKRLELPLKTNLLYKNYLMPLCPPDRTLDVKKSTYKKIGKFLDAMQQEGLVEVRELEKGVSALVALQLRHPALRSHAAPAHAPAQAPAPAAAPDAHDDYVPPVLKELFCITAAVVHLFPDHKKGAALSAAEVRAAVETHVRAVPNAAARGAVALDARTAKALGRAEQELVKWDELMSGVLGRMTAATELQLADGSRRLLRQRLPPVTMAVATRSGNKKVTLVSNLEPFGFSLAPLAAACQRAVAASCGVTRAPGSSGPQLLLQGDQTHYVAKLLIEKYGLPKKYVDGADKALKKKK